MMRRRANWDIGVADPTATNRWVAITTDGNSNKEPDWVPIQRARAAAGGRGRW